MLTRIVIFLALILSSKVGFGQTSCPGGSFTTQTQVNDFNTQNPDCTSADILSITLNGSLSDPITDLGSFGNLTFVDSLVISNINANPISLISLSGLGNLASAGDVVLTNVYNFTGLESLMSVTGELRITNNSATAQPLALTPFDNLVSAGSIYLSIMASGQQLTDVFPSLSALDSLIISQSTPNLTGMNLAALTGFDQLTSLALLDFGQNVAGTISTIGNFNILNNATHIDVININGLMCSSFGGFTNLQTVGNMSLLVRNNSGLFIEFPALVSAGNINITASQQANTGYSFPQLTSCGDLLLSQSYGYSPFNVQFPVLGSIGGNFQYIHTPASTTNAPFTLNVASLISIGGNFVVQGSLWTNLDAFQNLEFIGGGASLTGNYLLSDCDIYALCQLLSVNPSSVTVQNNAAGCNSVANMAVSCQIGGVSGVVYVDTNCNGIAEDGDVVVPNPVILDGDGLPFGQSSTNGTYYIPFAANTTFSITPQLIAGTIQASTIVLNTDNNEIMIGDNDLFLCPDPTIHDVAVSSYSIGPPRPGFSREYRIVISNLSYNTESGSVVFDISAMPGVTVQNAYTGTVNGSLISFSFENLPPLGQIVLELALHTSASTPIGTVQHPQVSVSIDNDLNLTNNVYSWNQTVVGSYDPNDITVDKPVINYESFIADNTWLHYTIRFQNTGNFPADFVRVNDEIEEDLDLSTIHVINTSHDYVLSFNGNQVSWFFDNIMLPDSVSDPLGSQGFIHYRIKMKSDVAMEDVIENTAAIYFDYNAPVITNTATTIFYVCPEQLEIASVGSLCSGENAELSGTTGYTNYNWILFDEVVSTEQSFGYDFIEGGTYVFSCVAETEYCSSLAYLQVNVYDFPAPPQITQSGNTLTASGMGTFTWMLNGEQLDETSNTLEITESGEYTVFVANGNCESSETTDNFIYNGIGEKSENLLFEIYPNPANDRLYFVTNSSAKIHVVVYDSSGRELSDKSFGGNNSMFDCTSWAEGIYHIKARTDNSDFVYSKSIVVIR